MAGYNKWLEEQGFRGGESTEKGTIGGRSGKGQRQAEGTFINTKHTRDAHDHLRESGCPWERERPSVRGWLRMACS